MRTLSAEDRLVGLATVWSEVKYNYPMWHRHPDLDWDAAFRERISLVLEDQSDWDYYRLLQALAALVRDSHVDVWPPQALTEGRSGPPVVLAALNEGFVVVGVAASVAEDVGVRLGDEIVSVNGVPVGEYAAEHVKPYVAAPTERNLMLRSSWKLLEGPVSTSVEVGLRRPDGGEYVCALSRPGEAGGEWLWYEPLVTGDRLSSRLVASGIGLIMIKTFGREEVIEEFDKALTDLGDVRGLILDLRMNGGGNSGWSDAIMGRLVPEPIPCMKERWRLYSSALRSWQRGEDGSGMVWETRDLGFIAPHRPPCFHGPLLILTDAGTHSAAEDFVGPLKVSGRSKTIGGTTAGSTGNPLFFELPGGGGFRVCTRYMLLPDGSEFIGTGIPADVEVCPKAADIASGHDPVLDRAVEEMREALE